MSNALLITFCGIAIVFLALVFLVLIFTAFGKAMGGKSKTQTKAKVVEKKMARPAVKAAPSAASEATGIPAEVIAVISAAIAAYEGNSSGYHIHSIRPRQGGRPVWAQAGIFENTRPF